jgi:translocation and assembly module TamA
MTFARAAALILVLVASSLLAGPAAASVEVRIEGLRGATLRDNAQRATSLHGWRDRAISEAQVRRLFDQAPGEIRAALEPHGYYRAEVAGDLQRDGERWIATFTIRVRVSVKVRELDIVFEGPGADDAALAGLRALFPLQPGDRLVHGSYERGKAAMLSAIQGRGYLRARAALTRVEVHVADDAADIRLHWQTGPRYRMGATIFEGSQFPDEFMQRFVQHQPGAYYDADELLKLQRRLIDVDYFGFVSVAPRLRGPGRRGGGRAGGAGAGAAEPAGQDSRETSGAPSADAADGGGGGSGTGAAAAQDPAPDPAPADAAGTGAAAAAAAREATAAAATPEAVADPGTQARASAAAAAAVAAEVAADDDVLADPAAAVDAGPTVPIVVQVAPAPRTVYTGGVSVGTDSGFGVRAGVRRRWLNERGHKANVELDLSQRLTAVAANYEILLPGANLRSLNFGLSHLREETDTSESDNTSVFAMENRQWRGWLRDVGLRALYSDFTIGEERNSSSLLFAEGRLFRRRANDDLFPTRGYSLRLEARAGAEALASDTDFVQIRAEGRLIHPLGERQRGYLRAIVGATQVDDFDALPPQLRFFAGGDRTIRGYGFQTLGPENDAGFVIGGKHLAVLSAEFERDVARDWAVAGFVDTGNAFSDSSDFELRTGVGVGVRWRSPVGLVRIDLGHGLDSPDNSIELHLVIGPDL